MSQQIVEDYAKNPGLSLEKLEAFLDEIENQPIWRPQAQREAAYYDGKQLDPDVAAAMRLRGQAPLVYNLIGPAIDGVLGIEAKSRTNWIVRAENDRSTSVAEALNQKLNEAARLCLADRACADAYAAQIKVGMGWVEINRSSDPFAYPYRANYVHRNEIFWDWHSRRPDLKDCRYIVRERWLDEDQALLAFPQHQRLIEAAVDGWRRWETIYTNREEVDVVLEAAYEQFQETVLDETQWYDSERRRLRVFEVWYRVYQRGTVMRTPDGRVVQFDENNMIHKVAVAQGMAQASVGIFPKMRVSYYIGPHRAIDIPSHLPHDNFPYVPFWGFREDGTMIPYGLIRRMMSPQDEVNARRSKMMWLLSAKRIIMDTDASNMAMEDIIDEAQRPDGVIRLNPARQNRDQYAFRIEQDFQLAAQQFQVMLESQKMIQDCAGIYNAMLGKQENDTQSGVAIASLVEQGNTTLAEINDNYRFARRLVGEHLLALVIDDLGQNQTEVAINVGKPEPTKIIVLNQRTTDEQGNVLIDNDVMKAKTQVVLDDIQATAGYRAQIANRLFELASTLPDDIKVQILDIVVDATDIPQRDEIVRRIRRVTGVQPDMNEMNDQERQEFEQQQAAKQQAQQLELEELSAKVRKLQAEAARSEAQAGKTNAETDGQKYKDRKLDVEADKILLEMQKLTEELQRVNQDLQADVDSKQAQLDAYESVMPELMKSSMALSATTPKSKEKPDGMQKGKG